MSRLPRDPVFLEPGDPAAFPDPTCYDAEGLVAVGGDLTVERLLAAYWSGVFPWYGEGYLPLWWSPDPRAVLTPHSLHVSRSLRKTMRRGGFELSWNRCFARVMRACAVGRRDGTWILPEMVEAYSALNRLGHAHSLEVWSGTALVGGIYGVQVGGAFCAESMFHRRTDMSKVALVALVRSLFAAGIGLFEVQFATEHLRSLGAAELTRVDYLGRLRSHGERDVDLRGLVPSIAGP